MHIGQLYRQKLILIKNSFICIRRMQSTSSNNSNDVLFEKVNNIGRITLNRAKQLNAINLPMVNDIYKQLKQWEDDTNVHAILIQNLSSSNAFCAGGDIKAIRENALNGNRHEALKFFKSEYTLNYAISKCKKPYIALINGIYRILNV